MKNQLKFNSQSKSNIVKVATDMFVEQSIWTLWYLIIIFIIHSLILIFTQERQENFVSFSQNSTRVYMLVIGIIAAYFIVFYIKQGVTRKDYFFGAVLASLGLAIAIPVFSTILNGLQHIVINLFNFTPVIDNTPFLGVDTNWLSIIFIYTLNILTYYIIGWIIGMGYYRYGWIIGFGFIALGVAFASVLEFLWSVEDAASFLSIEGPFKILILPADILIGRLSSIADSTIYFSFISTALLIGVGFWVIRMVTKRVIIKVK